MEIESNFGVSTKRCLPFGIRKIETLSKSKFALAHTHSRTCHGAQTSIDQIIQCYNANNENAICSKFRSFSSIVEHFGGFC